MPMYDYRCETCNRTFERFFSKFVESPNCTECGSVMSYEPSFWYNSRDAQSFTPVVIHRDSEGNIRLPGSVNAPVPPGFERVELRDIHQVRKFENEMNSKERDKAAEFRYAKSGNFDAQVRANREAMAQIVGKFSPRGRRFYDAMKEAADIKREQMSRRGTPEPNFHIDAFSFNASNREDYRDAANEWGRSGQRK